MLGVCDAHAICRHGMRCASTRFIREIDARLLARNVRLLYSDQKNAYNNFINRAYSYGENICALHASSLFWVIQMCFDCKCIVAGLIDFNLFRGTANRPSCGLSDDLERGPLIVGSEARKLCGHPKLRIGSSVYGLSAMPSPIGLLICEDAFMAGWLS